MTARILMRGQLNFLRGAGFRIAVASAPGEDLDRVAEEEGVEVFAVPIEREIRPLRDLRTLLAMRRVIRRFEPHLVNAGTPKAGLLAGLAARWCGVPARLYTLRGLRLETATGLRRALLTMAERLASRAAQHIVCVSPSLRDRYAEIGLAPRRRLEVIGAGSSNGVDVDRFRPRDLDDPEVDTWRSRLGIPKGAPVVGFVGRWTRDKGIVDLSGAFFGAIRERFPDARLLLVGAFEFGDPVPKDIRDRLLSDAGVLRPGFLDDVAPLYALMDVLAFPSYREGFPNAPLEAAAAAVPVAGYEATGTRDAVLHGTTGTLVPTGDTVALADAISSYLADRDLRQRHGSAGRDRVEREFRQERVWESWKALYERTLVERNLPRPVPQRGSHA